tara:strand:+ start:648 stop:779 length:132 start_codon:yes stop_codon:yes gene_type:complete
MVLVLVDILQHQEQMQLTLPDPAAVDLLQLQIITVVLVDRVSS